MKSGFGFSRRFRVAALAVLAVMAVSAVLLSRDLRLVLATPKDAGLSPLTLHSSNTRAIVDNYGKVPLNFERNLGQTDGEVKFIARGLGYGLFLTSSGAVLRLSQTASSHSLGDKNSAWEGAATASAARIANIIMSFDRARSVSNPIAVDRLEGKSNYFIGNNARTWHTNVPAYSKIRYPDIYPGIDLVYYGNQRQLEYDLILAPGASPNLIGINFGGTRDIKVDSSGDLVLSTDAGEVRQLRPIAYQNVNGTRREIAASYRVDRETVKIEIGEYDRSLPLTIDPVLAYSSFLGGAGAEQGTAIAVDSQGSAYLTGVTTSTDFPLASPLQGTKDAVGDAFVVKLNPAGTALVYATYLGANGDDAGNGIAVDSQGNAYVAGLTGSGSFPTTPGAFQDMKDGALDGFITKLNSSGSALLYSTFVGGDNNDTVLGVAVDSSNRPYLVGRTDSTRFRTAPFPTPRKGSGIYKSTDATAHWDPSAAGLTASIVNSITQDPATASILYAATTTGVFKSIDGGTNWTLTGFGPPVNAPLATSAVVIDPTNANTIYAASTSSGIYKSTNGGSTYAQKNTGLGNLSVLALALDPNAPAILYAGTQLGAFKSTDGGDNWTAINNGTNSSRVNKIVIDPSQNPATTIYLGMQSRGMLKSTNGGALWSQINNGLSSFTPVSAVAMDPLSPSTLYAGVFGLGDPVYKTTNGGGTWSPSGSGLLFTFAGQPAFPTVNSIAVDLSNVATVYAASSGGAIYKSTNAGANWSQSNTGFINANANAIVIDRTNNANLFAATSIGNDAFALRLSGSGSLEYLLNFGGDENDEARGVAVDGSGNAYVGGFTNSNNLPVVNALQPVSGGASDAFVAKISSGGASFNYLTYLGGNASDQARGIAVRGGNAYVTGSTSSGNFPLLNPLKGTLADFDTDIFVTKLNAAGSALDYSTYLGGQSSDQGFAIAVDSNGSAYITGSTNSSDFPVQSAPQSTISVPSDAVVTKLTPTGNAIAYSTFLGATGSDQGNGIAVDTSGNAYVIGNTSSAGFPTVNPLQNYHGATDAFVTKLSAAADIVVTMAGSPGSVSYHGSLTYTIAVSNAGEIPAENVQLISTLLSGTGVLSINTNRGSCSGNRVITCSLATMDPGATATITLVVLPPAVTPMVNTATASTSTPDSNMGNNTSSLNTPVIFTDVIVKKTSALKLTEVGGVNTYIITVTNKGPAAASTITVTDNLPAQTTFVTCTATNSAVCGGSGNNRNVTVSSLAVNASFTATIAARINNSVTPGAVISNTASMTSVVPDINPNNDAQTAITTAKAAAAGPPQNGLIAFSSRDGSINSGADDIWIANSDGTAQRDLTYDEALQDFWPVWSPDGGRIAFEASLSGIYLMNADGSNRIQLTNFSQDTAPSWSPDGTRIAFASSRGPGPYTIFVMNSDGTNQKPIGNGNVGNNPSWSPDGAQIAFANGLGVGMMYADGSGARTISLPRVPFARFGWSPDSSKLAMGMPDNTTLGSSIYIMNADGTGLNRIDNTSGAQTACWSPDGTKIAFNLTSSAGPNAGIYTINPDGTGLLKISGPVNGGFHPDWQRQPPNFTPLPPSFSISGQITNAANGTSVPAQVNITGTLTRTVDADQNGNYIIKGLAGGGNYTLTPFIFFGGATSSPPNRQFNNLSANQTGADFSLTFAPLPPVNGFVKNHLGAPLVGVRVGLRNSIADTDRFTDSNGFFDFAMASLARSLTLSASMKAVSRTIFLNPRYCSFNFRIPPATILLAGQKLHR